MIEGWLRVEVKNIWETIDKGLVRLGIVGESETALERLEMDEVW